MMKYTLKVDNKIIFETNDLDEFIEYLLLYDKSTLKILLKEIINDKPIEIILSTQ